MTHSSPTASAPTPQDLQVGGRTTTTGNGVAHVAPETNGAGIQPELLTTRQAAELLSIGERTLWRWSRSGICPPCVSIGIGPRPACRYRRSELQAWIDGGCQPVEGRAAR